jgi:K+-sensing histidine kinase KdpD
MNCAPLACITTAAQLLKFIQADAQRIEQTKVLLSDNGRGMPADSLSKVFDLFVQQELT